MSPAHHPPPKLWLPILATAIALIVVHGLGRFAYTPLLPMLVADGVFSLQTGATMATWNYIGYLLGAVLAIRFHHPDHIRRALPLALATSAITTSLQIIATDPTLFLVLRLFNGISNGIVFVQAPALVLEWLSRHGKLALSGLVYFGVGTGLLLSNALAWWPHEILHGMDRWWPMALCAIPLAAFSGWHLMRLDRPDSPQAAAPTPHTTTPLIDRKSLPLFMAYAGAGLGYILPTTFLPVVAKEQLPADHWLLGGAWTILACCTLGAAWLWNQLGARLGDKTALLLNYAIQGAGVFAPLLFSGSVGVLLCAVLVGTTFLGSVLLSQRLGRNLHPHQGPRISAGLVTLYAFTQLTGPWMARWWLDHGASMTDTYLVGGVALVWAWLWTLRTPKA